MPFDFKKYDEKCAGLTAEQLQLEWNHYTRLITSASTSTAVSSAAVPATFGVSAVGVVLAAPALHNARKKRTIIERHLQTHNTTHITRARDVLPSVAISGASGVMGLHGSHAAAEAIMSHAASHSAAAELAVQAGIHTAMEGANMGGEHLREKKKHAKATRTLSGEAAEDGKKMMKERRKELKAERKGVRRNEKAEKKALKKKAKEGHREEDSESEEQGNAELPTHREVHAPVPMLYAPRQAPVYHEADTDAGAHYYQMPAPTPAPYIVSPLPPSENYLKTGAVSAVSAVEPDAYRVEPWRAGQQPYVVGPAPGTTYHELA
ncbi:hypothetical protein F4810DRAFT_673876 [Camillea tinctor]|nr:hypothetical protein F4810DRAFT_673876 [Camillea tinctor]